MTDQEEMEGETESSIMNKNQNCFWFISETNQEQNRMTFQIRVIKITTNLDFYDPRNYRVQKTEFLN